MNGEEDKKRTLKQNNAIHLYCTLLASAFNDSGQDMRTVLKPSVSIPWTPENVKEFLWKPIQKALLHKDSTTELDRVEVNKVYEILSTHLAEKFGVFEEFPHIEEENK